MSKGGAKADLNATSDADKLEHKKAAIRVTLIAEDLMLTRRQLFKNANPLLTEEQIAEEVVKPLWAVNLDRTRKKCRKMLKQLAKMPMPLNMSKEECQPNVPLTTDQTITGSGQLQTE